MSVLKEWRDYAYGLDDRTPEGKQFWLNYFGVEQGIYKQLLKNPDEIVTGTVKELAEKYEKEGHQVKIAYGRDKVPEK